MSHARIFIYQAVLLVAVVTPLAIAEQAWPPWLITILAVAAGGWRLLRGQSPLLGRTLGAVVIVAAFLLLLFEYAWLVTPAVIALSHFMMLVCACKMLQQQSHRDRIQVLVLCLLLLVVAAITSGDILFPLVLLLYLTLGLHTLILLQMDLDGHRIHRHNLAAAPGQARRSPSEVEAPPSRTLLWTSAAAGLVGLGVGVLVFLFFPRVGAGMFGRLDTGGKALAGFASSLTFDTIGAVQLSEKPVMVVTLRVEGAAPADFDADQLYFRGAVFDCYCRENGPVDTWQWRNADEFAQARMELAVARDAGLDETIRLLDAAPLPNDTPLLYQQYLTQPLEHPYLFSCYPPLEIHSPQIRQVIKNPVHQTIRLSGKVQGSLRYEIASVMRDSQGQLPYELLNSLSEVQGAESEPAVLPPTPPLPREAEIRAQIGQLDNAAGVQGPLDTPQQRLAFAQAVMDFLHGPTFVYRLQSGSPGDRDPIGNFLLNRREGYCQHFAAAMAVLCQYRGIPTRVVSGYRGGDYNPLGHCLVVREKHAHSWVEMYIPGLDWVTFDPTPSTSQDALRSKRRFLGLHKYLDYLQYQWANAVVAYDAQIREHLATGFEQWLRRPTGKEETLLGAVTAFLRELIWWRVELGFRDRLLYWVFAIMVSILAILIAYVITAVGYKGVVHTRRWWSARRSRQPGDAVEFYERFCRRISALGLKRNPHQTPVEFAEELTRRFPVLAGADQLTRAYYQVAYGRYELDAATRTTVEAFLQRLAGIEHLDPDESIRDH